MADKIVAADEMLRFARQLKAMMDVAEEIRQVGSLEQYTAEANAGAEAAKKRMTEAREAAGQADRELQRQRTAIEAAKAEAARILNDARSQAERLLDEASGAVTGKRREGEAIVAGAKEEAARIVQAAQAQRTAADQTMAQARQAVSEMDDAIKARKAELAAVEGRIKAAKAQIAVLLQ